MFDWLYSLYIRDYVYLILMLIAIMFMLINYRRLPHNTKPLLLFACTHFSIELLSDYVHYGLNQSNLILYHAFAPISYLILTIFFYRTFTDEINKRNIRSSFLLYLILVIFYTCLWEPFTQFNSLAYMTESLLVIYWCSTFFKTILLKGDLYRPEHDRTFWIVIGLLFYYAGSFFTIGSLNYFLLKHLNSLGSKIYYASYAFGYLLYITLSIVNVVNLPRDSHEQRT